MFDNSTAGVSFINQIPGSEQICKNSAAGVSFINFPPRLHPDQPVLYQCLLFFNSTPLSIWLTDTLGSFWGREHARSWWGDEPPDSWSAPYLTIVQQEFLSSIKFLVPNKFAKIVQREFLSSTSPPGYTLTNPYCISVCCSSTVLPCLSDWRILLAVFEGESMLCLLASWTWTSISVALLTG